MSKVSFQDLPDEILTIILSFCPISDVCHLAMVCQLWGSVIRENPFWELYFKRVGYDSADLEGADNLRVFAQKCAVCDV